MELITGRTGVQHVKAIDDAEIYKSVFGDGDYVLETGAKFNASMSGTNAIIIQNGTAIMQGRQVKIREADGQETLPIATGTAGYKRWDVVCIEYNIEDDIESARLVVVKGSTSQDWQEPTIQYEDGDIDSGETHRMKLWGVKLNGINFDSLVDYRQIVVGNVKDMAEEAAEEAKEAAEQIKNAIVTITGSITISISGAKGYKEYTAQELQTYGIDDISEYTILGITQSGGATTQRWTPYIVVTNQVGALSENMLYPYARINPNDTKPLSVCVYNNANGERTYEFDVILLKK